MHTTHRTLAALGLILATRLCAQIPNPGFESWMDMGGYLDPIGWATLNAISTPGELFVERVPGYTGAFAMRMTTRSQFGVPSAAGCVSGTFNGEGFPWTERSAAFSGMLQFHAAAPNDAAAIAVSLSRWDDNLGTRVNIGTGYLEWDTEASTWTAFSVPITYTLTSAPDTAIILFSSSIAEVQAVDTYVIFDALAFTGTSTGTAEALQRPYTLRMLPDGDTWSVENSGAAPLRSVLVTDGAGRVVLDEPATGRSTMLRLHGLAPGIYLFTLRTVDGNTFTERIVKP